MSTKSVRPPAPKPGQLRKRMAPMGRIDGVGAPVPRTLTPSPQVSRASTPVAEPPKKPVCPNCRGSDFVVDNDGSTLCNTCGVVIRADSNLVSDQTFTETSSGAIRAEGTMIHENQTHARTYGGIPGLSTAGREATLSRDKAEQSAKHVMTRYAALLSIRQTEVDAGLQFFKLAYTNSFVQGRTIESVAVCCLYLACRRKREQTGGLRMPVYSLMLIDFAEKAAMDVFALGKMYGDLVRKLYLQQSGKLDEGASADLLAMGPEVLINRFVEELEFERQHREKIRNDAIRIVARMKRDWMSTGRRPAGVCGAAIILAARMNNYRRTTREVVLTAKVTEITINKRLDEFRDLPSSNLSVSQFRNDSVLNAIAEADPPVLNPKETVKRKRGRPKKIPEVAVQIELEDDDDEEDNETNPPSPKRSRIDKDGFVIPDLPRHVSTAEPATSAASSSSGDSDSEADAESRPRGPGRPKGFKPWKAPPATAAELAIETELENDIQQTLRENPDIDPTYQPVSGRPPEPEIDPELEAATGTAGHQGQPNDGIRFHEVIVAGGRDGTASQSDKLTASRRPRPTPGPPVDGIIGNTGRVSLSPTLHPEEFDSDPDVSSCLLTEEEKSIKERVWVSMNADWLRQDHAKRIRRELREAEMRARGEDPERVKKGKRRRAGRRGDVSYLNRQDGAGKEGGDGREDALGEGEAGRRTPAEAVKSMLNVRGVFSRRVNYGALEELFGTAGDDDSSSSRSRSESVVSERQGGAAPSEVDSASAAVTPFRGNIGRKKGKERAPLSLERQRRGGAQRARRQGSVASSSAGGADGEEENEAGPSVKSPPSSSGSAASSQAPRQLPTPTTTQSRGGSQTIRSPERAKPETSAPPPPPPPPAPAAAADEQLTGVEEVLGAVVEEEEEEDFDFDALRSQIPRGIVDEDMDEGDDSEGSEGDYVDDD